MFSGVRARPDIGTVYNCETSGDHTILEIPDIKECKTNFSPSKVQHYRAEVRQYHPVTTDVKIYHCKANEISLECIEGFFGQTDKSRFTKTVTTSRGECDRAAERKVSRYGKLFLLAGVWTTVSHKHYRCAWMTTKTVKIVRYRITETWAQVIGASPILKQSLTASKCMARKQSCIPVEFPQSVIIWKKFTHSFSEYVSQGIFKVRQIHDFILIGELGIAGAILRQDRDMILLENGYILFVKNQNGSRQEKRQVFLQLGRNYSHHTKSSTQRELLTGQIVQNMLADNERYAHLAGLLCGIHRDLKRLELHIVAESPREGAELLYPNQGKQLRRLGDGLEVSQCRSVKNYKILWDRRINNTCYFLYPVKLQHGKIRFLELDTRRLLQKSHRINCSHVEELLVVKDKNGRYWEKTQEKGWRKIKLSPFTKFRKGHRLPALGKFRTTLYHIEDTQPQRNTLLHYLQEQSQNLDTLTDFRDLGSGNILDGIVQSITSTVEGMGKAGAQLVRAVSTGLVSTVRAGTNATESLLVATGITSLLEGIGGAPSLALYVIDLFIITYLVIQYRMNRNIRQPLVIPMERQAVPIPQAHRRPPPPIPDDVYVQGLE